RDESARDADARRRRLPMPPALWAEPRRSASGRRTDMLARSKCLHGSPMSRVTATGISMLAAVLAAGCGASSTGIACDRSCLVDIADRYLAAIAARDPREAPLSEEAAFVENLESM